MLYLVIVILLGIIAYLLMRPANEAPRQGSGWRDCEMISPQERRRRQAMEHLKQEGEITNEKYRELTGVSQSQATRDLDELERQGLIKQLGRSGPHVKYKLK